MTNGKAGDIGGSPPVKDTMQLRNLPPQVLTGISQVALGLVWKMSICPNGGPLGLVWKMSICPNGGPFSAIRRWFALQYTKYCVVKSPCLAKKFLVPGHSSNFQTRPSAIIHFLPIWYSISTPSTLFLLHSTEKLMRNNRWMMVFHENLLISIMRLYLDTMHYTSFP